MLENAFEKNVPHAIMCAHAHCCACTARTCENQPLCANRQGSMHSRQPLRIDPACQLAGIDALVPASGGQDVHHAGEGMDLKMSIA